MADMRNQTRQIKLGDLAIGGGAPVAVQSMCNTDTRDTSATLAQIGRLAEVGCEIVPLTRYIFFIQKNFHLIHIHTP